MWGCPCTGREGVKWAGEGISGLWVGRQGGWPGRGAGPGFGLQFSRRSSEKHFGEADTSPRARRISPAIPAQRRIPPTMPTQCRGTLRSSEPREAVANV